MKSGFEAREDFEYQRCGVANIFLASEPLKGKRFVEVVERKTKTDWAKFVKQIAHECVVNNNFPTGSPPQRSNFITSKAIRAVIVYAP